MLYFNIRSYNSFSELALLYFDNLFFINDSNKRTFVNTILERISDDSAIIEHYDNEFNVYNFISIKIWNYFTAISNFYKSKNKNMKYDYYYSILTNYYTNFNKYCTNSDELLLLVNSYMKDNKISQSEKYYLCSFVTTIDSKRKTS